MLPASQKTVMTLAVAIEIATGVVHELSGSETATTLNGQRLTRQALGDATAAQLYARFAKHTSRPTTAN